ncbi:hypothetical protein ACL00U_06375 [Curtobacterium poinsettiae]|uniref:hypothetical protein n=1 Tax=Curtobacterium poinsettiae TaxID=159612 RepID=UPI0039A2F440
MSEQHRKNVALFESAGWSLLSVQEGMAFLSARLDAGLDEVTIDYSSMPRKVLAAIIGLLAHAPRPLEARFIYSEPTFESSRAAALKDVNLTAGPVSPLFAGDARPLSAPIGLILGLGMELHRGLGVVELLEPERIWAMVADSSDPSFSDAATANHASLFGEVDSVSLLSYPLNSISRSYAMLFSLISSASQKYRVVLVPSGPKPLALAAMIASLDVPGPRPALWRVGSLSSYEPSDVRESGESVAVQVRFG